MTLPLRKRWEFVFLSRHRRGPKLSTNQVAHEVSVRRSTVEHWLGVYDATNDAIEEPRAGRGRSTSQQQDVKIVEPAEAHEDMISAGISGRLKRKGVEVSPRTVRRRRTEAGLESLKPSFRPLLNKKCHKTRLDWAKKNASKTWDAVVFSDETTFELYRKVARVWRRKRLWFAEQLNIH